MGAADGLEALVKQMNVALEAWVSTFQDQFWQGSAVQRAAFQIEEMRGGRTMASRNEEQQEQRRIAEEASDQRARGVEEGTIAEAIEVLELRGYRVEKPTEPQ